MAHLGTPAPHAERGNYCPLWFTTTPPAAWNNHAVSLRSDQLCCLSTPAAAVAHAPYTLNHFTPPDTTPPAPAHGALIRTHLASPSAPTQRHQLPLRVHTPLPSPGNHCQRCCTDFNNSIMGERHRLICQSDGLCSQRAPTSDRSLPSTNPCRRRLRWQLDITTTLKSLSGSSLLSARANTYLERTPHNQTVEEARSCTKPELPGAATHSCPQCLRDYSRRIRTEPF